MSNGNAGGSVLVYRLVDSEQICVEVFAIGSLDARDKAVVDGVDIIPFGVLGTKGPVDLHGDLCADE